MQKLIVRVIRAMKKGADTSNEIAEMLNRPVANVSATLSEMQESGIVRRTGRWKHFSRKQKSYCYELVD